MLIGMVYKTTHMFKTLELTRNDIIEKINDHSVHYPPDSLYPNSLPLILRHNVDESELSINENNELIKLATHVFNEAGNPSSPNHPWNNNTYSIVCPQTPTTDKLAKIFYKHLIQTFSNIDKIPQEKLNSKKPLIHTKNMEVFSVYLSDKNNYKSQWHNHQTTSTIAMVYYPSISKGASITFKNAWNGKMKVKIKERTMMIFPSWMTHKPNKPTGDGIRICYNSNYLSFNRPCLSIKKLNNKMLSFKPNEFTDKEIDYIKRRIANVNTHRSYNPNWTVW